MGRGGSNPPSDTNRTYTSEISFYQHPSIVWFVGEGQSDALVQSGLLLLFSGIQDADEIPEALHHRSDVVFGERRRWTASAELLLGRPCFGLDSLIHWATTAGSVPASRASR
jgi:hypothetical protein